MIRITSQGAEHQYDEDGRAITTWDHKKCNWIVNEEFENEEIDWYGKDSDFPAGCTMKEFLASNPDWDKNPDVTVTWYWDTKQSAIAAFGSPHTFLPLGHPNSSNYWDVQKYPYTAVKQWGYLSYDKDEALERLGKYCDFHKHADRTVVKYNEETLFDGKLK